MSSRASNAVEHFLERCGYRLVDIARQCGHYRWRCRVVGHRPDLVITVGVECDERGFKLVHPDAPPADALAELLAGARHVSAEPVYLWGRPPGES